MADEQNNGYTPQHQAADAAAPQKKGGTLRIVLITMGITLAIVGCTFGVLMVINRIQGGQGPSQAAQTVSASSQGTAAPDADAAEQAQPAPTPTVNPVTINAMMIGDVLMHDELVQSGATGDGFDYGFLFDHIKPEIDAADLRILGQETVMGEPERGYSLFMGGMGPVMNTPTALADTEVAYGFNCILKSSNHVLDLGYSGLGHELDYWKATYPQIPVVGVDNPNKTPGDTSQDLVHNVYVYEKDGFKVGIINHTYDTNEHFGDEDWQYVSYLSEDKVAEDVQKCRDAGADMIIACPHWGVQYDTMPSEEEFHYSQLMCNLGVDVIFGCHPHILQPVELLQSADGHKTVCFYSNGNFVAAGGMETNTLVGGISRVTLQREADGTCHVTAASMQPTVICYTWGPNMSAFPIQEWTNDLAAQSVRSDLTVDYAYSWCSDVLGEGFDPNTGVYTLDVNGPARTV